MNPPSLSPSIFLIITYSHAVNITLQVVTLTRGAPDDGRRLREVVCVRVRDVRARGDAPFLLV